MCCAVYLLYDYNFREINEVWDGSKCWFSMLLLNTRDQV